jgi:hypothetical protein
MTQYFNARTWGAFGFNLEQIRYLQDLTDKLNTVEEGAEVNPADQEVQNQVQPLVNSMAFMLMGA